MKAQKMTIREIRKILFDTDHHAVIGQEEMANKEARDYLYNKENQDEILNVITCPDHLLIW